MQTSLALFSIEAERDNNIRSPVFGDLKGLFDKTTGLLPVLQQILEPFKDRIELAFIYGSVARSEESSGSDIDLLTIGGIGLADLVPAMRKAEQALGRPVNPTVFSAQEFIRKAKARDHFLSTVLSGPKRFLKGSELRAPVIVSARAQGTMLSHSKQRVWQSAPAPLPSRTTLKPAGANETSSIMTILPWPLIQKLTSCCESPASFSPLVERWVSANHPTLGEERL